MMEKYEAIFKKNVMRPCAERGFQLPRIKSKISWPLFVFEDIEGN
jgi:hypothetical protein